ncbi:MAG: UMP kinase [Candidatus Lokiarchaeota archaeon]|nr:UMP kinase [Candidatus Lokiarchaeota archaeon]
MTKNIVIKFGGSLLFSEGGTINYEKITEFCDLIKNDKNYDSIVIVCGGGTIARQYIKAIREFTENEILCDMIGIDLSRINSRLIVANMEAFAYPQVPESFGELSKAIITSKIVVMGGLQPGQSTTSVAIQVAEFLKAERLIILTDVDGIYDKDPKVADDAKLLRELNYDSLQKIILEKSKENQAAAGEYRIFDAVSLQILKRSNVVVSVISGSNLDQFKKLWNNEKANVGTTITK